MTLKIHTELARIEEEGGIVEDHRLVRGEFLEARFIGLSREMIEELGWNFVKGDDWSALARKDTDDIESQ